MFAERREIRGAPRLGLCGWVRAARQPTSAEVSCDGAAGGSIVIHAWRTRHIFDSNSRAMFEEIIYPACRFSYIRSPSLSRRCVKNAELGTRALIPSPCHGLEMSLWKSLKSGKWVSQNFISCKKCQTWPLSAC